MADPRHAKAGRRAEAAFLIGTGEIRENLLLYTPDDVDEEDDFEYLHLLGDIYYPHNQPRNAYEEAYLDLMREAICARLTFLGAPLSPM